MNTKINNTPAVDNPTRALIAESIHSDRQNVKLDVNAAFISLGAVLVGGRPGDVKVAFTAGESVTQGNGVVGGGTLANMLDCSMAIALMSALSPGQTCSTISITVNMMRPANVGVLMAQARVDRLGKRVAFASAALHDKEGRAVANAMSSLAIL